MQIFKKYIIHISCTILLHLFYRYKCTKISIHKHTLSAKKIFYKVKVLKKFSIPYLTRFAAKKNVVRYIYSRHILPKIHGVFEYQSDVSKMYEFDAKQT